MAENGKTEGQVIELGHAGASAEGQVDVRTVSTGLLLYNLVLCTATLQHNSAALQQMKAVLHAQKLVGTPVQVQQLEAVVSQQAQARDIMVKNLEERFLGLDQIYWAKHGIPFEAHPDAVENKG